MREEYEQDLEAYVNRAIGENRAMCPVCQSKNLEMQKGNVLLCLDCGHTFRYGKSPEQVRELVSFLIEAAFGPDEPGEVNFDPSDQLRLLKQASHVMEKMKEPDLQDL